MYNIKQAATRAGVTVPVLRAWERRYGIVRPERTANGYRQFDDAAVDRIREMRGLIAQGWSPSAAAAAILAGDVPDIAAEAGGISTRRPPDADAPAGAARAGAASADADGASRAEAQALASGFVVAARDLDPAAVDRILDDVFSRGSFERVAADLLFPALERLGDAWASGVVSVAGEHMASNAVLRRLGQALEGAGAATRSRPRIVVGLPAGARHELGALAFAVAARRAGLAVAYLGADVPLDDWVAATAEADAAVIGVVTGRDRRAAVAVARALVRARPELVVAFGGHAAPKQEGVLRLPVDLPSAVEALDSALSPAAS
jgi:MerR family transcriptional regulator, light-induced transcriptional regulator